MRKPAPPASDSSPSNPIIAIGLAVVGSGCSIAVGAAAGKNGLLLLSCGVRGNVIRILAPLTIPFEHLDEGLGILAAQFKACL